MTSRLPVRKAVESVRKIVTDLDVPDEVASDTQQKVKRTHRHRERIAAAAATKELKQLGGNFPQERSRSAEKVSKNVPGYLQILVQTKDEQIEKLLGKVTDLQNYNEQFSVENENLRSEVHTLSERLQHLSTQLAEYQKKECSKCSQYERLQNEWESLRCELTASNRSLMDDVSMLKTLVYRLNVQLEHYQELLRKTRDEDDIMEPIARSPSEDNETINRKWGTIRTHSLAPLLNSYEEMLRDKDDLIVQHDREMNRFTGHLKEIIAENERLHLEMDDLQKGKDGWLEERIRLQAQLEICRSKAEVQTRRADIAKEKLVEVLRCYEQKVQSQVLDIERLHEAYTRAKGEILTLRNTASHPDTIVASLKECQRLFEELKSQHDNEKAKIAKDLDECRRLHAELDTTTKRLREENDNLRALVERQRHVEEGLRKKCSSLRHKVRGVNEARDNLKVRLRTALEWAHKLEESRDKMKSTWNELRELEVVVKHKDAQIRGLHARQREEVENLERKLRQREETIKFILQEKAKLSSERKLGAERGGGK